MFRRDELNELLNNNKHLLITEIKHDNVCPVAYVEIAVPYEYKKEFITLMKLMDMKIGIKKEDKEFKKKLEQLMEQI